MLHGSLNSSFCRSVPLTSLLFHHPFRLCPSRAIIEYGLEDRPGTCCGTEKFVSHLQLMDSKMLILYRVLHDEVDSDVTIEYRDQPGDKVLGVWHADAQKLCASSRFFAPCLDATSVSAQRDHSTCEGALLADICAPHKTRHSANQRTEPFPFTTTMAVSKSSA